MDKEIKKAMKSLEKISAKLVKSGYLTHDRYLEIADRLTDINYALLKADKEYDRKKKVNYA